MEIWTNEGKQSCPTTPVGTCNVRFTNPTEDGWIEARFLGDNPLLPLVDRVTAPVREFATLGVFSPGRAVTRPNCGTKYLKGTFVLLEATPPTNYELAGWSYGIGEPFFTSDFVIVQEDGFLQPRFAPICFTLAVTSRPHGIPLAPPSPAPNCDDPQAPDFSAPDLTAIRNAEVAARACATALARG